MRPSFRPLEPLLLIVVAIALAASANAAGARPLRQATPPAGTPHSAIDPWAAIQPRFRAEIAADTAGRLPRYRIAATVRSQGPRHPPTLEGSLELALPSGSAFADGAYFRLYPNDPSYAEGGISVDAVSVNGVAVAPELSASDTILRVPVPDVPPGEELVISMRFETTVPARSEAGFGIFSAKPRSGSAAMAHWHPLLAGRTAAGWQLSTVGRNGDIVFSNAALYEIVLDLPAWMDTALPGATDVLPSDPDRRTVRSVMGPAREVPLLVDDGWDVVQATGGGVTVRVHGEPRYASEMAAVAGWAEAALQVFSERFGPYPYASLDVVLVDLAGALGMEFPSLIVLDPDVFGPDHAANPRFPEIVVAHEMAHQWWYGLVENDQYADAFIDEGLAQYAGAGIYPEDRYGASEAERQVQSEIRDWYEAALARSGDFVAHQPSEAFPDMSAYGMAVYAKSALGFAAIRQDIGDAAFFGGLTDAARDSRFEVIDAARLRAAFERACGCDVGPTWTLWFESAATPTATPGG